MRPLVVVMSLIMVGAVLPERGDFRGNSDAPQVTIYDPNPTHLWNRLYATLLIREDRHGNVYGEDSLDPLLWGFTKHLLEGDSHRQAIHVLDEFLQTHGESLIRDPVKRAMLQRDLWAVFDWSVARKPSRPGEPAYEAETRELQVRLAEAMRRVALTQEEIEALPDNYAQALASGEFAKEYDPQHKDPVFLPPDLFQEYGPWVGIGGDYLNPATSQHVTAFSGRSRFLIFIRLPAGRKAAYDYFRELWNFPQPWIARPDAPNQPEINPELPSFPPGTEVALVRQMTLFDKQGNLAPAPITESVQVRVYENVTSGTTEPAASLPDTISRNGQHFYEIRLSRRQLFAGKSGGLRAVGPDEKELFQFNAMGFDEFENPPFRVVLTRTPPILEECFMCHRGVGINSLNSRANLLRPNSLQQDHTYAYPPRWWENDATVDWKQTRFDWGLLRGYWAAAQGR